MLTYTRCLAGLHRHYFMVSPPPPQEAGGIFTPNCQVKQLRFRQLNGLSQGNRCANPGSMTQGHQEARLERVWEGWDTLGAGALGLRGKAGDCARVTAWPKRPHLGVCPGPNIPLQGPQPGALGP